MPQQNDPGFTLSSLLILAALGLFAWSSSPLQSARPTSEPKEAAAKVRDAEVPARLWQDPLDAIRRHTVMVREAAENALGARRSLSAEIADALEEPRGPEDELTVLLVPLTPGSYAELEEGRRRRRYAILSALGAAHFVPRSADLLGLHRVPPMASSDDASQGAASEDAARRDIASAGEASEQEASEGDDATAVIVPYEWYEYEDPVTGERAKRSVLVLWIDETWLGDEPFGRILHLVREIHGLAAESDADRVARFVRWSLIGPSTSGTLRAMVDDSGSDAVEDLRIGTGLRSFSIVSPMATVDDCDLEPSLGSCAGGHGFGPADPSRLLGDAFAAPCTLPAAGADGPVPACMRFLRTVRSDADLIEALARELAERRGVGRGDRVLVLSEWDTYFGRSLPRALERVLDSQDSGIELRQYTYERGIDGVAYGEPVTRLPDRSDRDDPPLSREPASVRRPFGAGQFDYLRRFAQAIHDEDRRLRVATGAGIEAVAVLGSDVYDKLLILRALRDRLAGAVFITTDLDANLLHPDEFAWARNLIIASTFDLALLDEIQGPTPPFRDSYQTATYLATRLALLGSGAAAGGTSCGHASDPLATFWGPDAGQTAADPLPGQGALYASLPPLLFEVGRHGVVRLPESSHVAGGGPVLTETREWPLGGYFLGGVLLAVVGLFMVHQIRPRSGRVVLALSAVLVVGGAMLLIAVATADGGEPLGLRDGVSVWPTIAIRLFTAALTVVFVCSAVRRLDRSWQDLDQRYFHVDGVEPERDRGLTLRQAVDALISNVRPRAWAIACLALLAAVVISMACLRRLSLPLVELLLVRAVTFGVLITAWWMLLYKGERVGVRVDSINEWLAGESKRDAVAMWHSYRDYGRPEQRILRSAGTGLVYLAFGQVVFALLGGSGSPARGSLASTLNGLSIGVGVPLMILLLFLIVDAIRLCIGWIEKMLDPGLDWSAEEIAAVAARRRLSDSVAKHWLQVQLIGERTRELSRLIYYPLIVILLMLLARSTYFDDFDLPVALAVIVGINFTIALVAAAALNAVARSARETVLNRLREASARLEQAEEPDVPPATPKKIDELVDELAKLDIGAFQRFWDQPLVRATVLLVTGLGLAYSEYGWLMR